MICFKSLSSTARAFLTAWNDPEWATRSGFAKFNAMKSYSRRERSSLIRASVTSFALISGLSS